jgi:hypothetical protein
MRFKVDSLQLKVKPGNRAEREGEAQLRGRQRRVGVEADSEGSEDPRSTNRSVGHPRFSAFVVEPSLHQLSRGLVHHGNLLIARVKITSYNQHCSAPFFRAPVSGSGGPTGVPRPDLGRLALPSLLGRRSRQRHLIRPTTSRNPLLSRSRSVLEDFGVLVRLLILSECTQRVYKCGQHFPLWYKPFFVVLETPLEFLDGSRGLSLPVVTEA